MLIGYARTSTTEQAAGLEAQERDLRAAGAERLFSEQVSSVAARGALAEALAYLREGDALVVTKPDRLARDTQELLAINADLSKRSIGLIVLSMGGEKLDTRNPTSGLILTILAGVAEWERKIMLDRQREGIARAKADGKYKGRAPTARRLSPQIHALHAEGTGPVEIAKRLRLSRASVWRVLSSKSGTAA
jgi:DNA invertase Pin-like site-specific DNA recombinase